MRLADYFVKVLQEQGVTDAFGIPGGVILEFIYALSKSKTITPHLCYHEQSAGFAASGYAQVSGKLGVAYATRGPGFTNMVTAIADAYCDSIPVLFITSHAAALNPAVRLQSNQEIDTVAMVSKVTKYAKRVDTIEDFVDSVNKACFQALEGRKGPVFLDIASSLWKKEMEEDYQSTSETKQTSDFIEIIKTIEDELGKAKRPVILIGDGINQTKTGQYLYKFIEGVKVPVISSRYAHHTLAKSHYYFGYIGGFGVRYSNFILSKTDLIISLGNRLNFPLTSESYKGIPYQAKIVRIDIDDSELQKDIPNSINFGVDLKDFMPELSESAINIPFKKDWLEVCETIKEELWDDDINEPIRSVESILRIVPDGTVVLNDVGNNEFWISRACAHASYSDSVLYSKSFASLGCAMVKVIGAYYATRKPLLCFIGDQGFQMNSQELQYISQHNVPVVIVIMNNTISGMIRDKERGAYDGQTLHSTSKDGYLLPNLEKLAMAYGIDYMEMSAGEQMDKTTLTSLHKPLLVNLKIDESLVLAPTLPRGRAPQDMVPSLESKRYDFLNRL